MSTEPRPTGEMAALRERVLKALQDPGSITPRRFDRLNGEAITDWQTRAVLDALGLEVCPECGNRVPDERTQRLTPGEVFCSPLTCSAWRTEAIYDHDQRRFVPVSPDQGGDR